MYIRDSICGDTNTHLQVQEYDMFRRVFLVQLDNEVLYKIHRYSDHLSNGADGVAIFCKF